MVIYEIIFFYYRQSSILHIWNRSYNVFLRHFVLFACVCFLFVILSGNLNKPWIHCPILFNVSWQYCSRTVENFTSFESSTHGSVFTPKKQERVLLRALRLFEGCRILNSVIKLSQFYSTLCLCMEYVVPKRTRSYNKSDVFNIVNF